MAKYDKSLYNALPEGVRVRNFSGFDLQYVFGVFEDWHVVGEDYKIEPHIRSLFRTIKSPYGRNKNLSKTSNLRAFIEAAAKDDDTEAIKSLAEDMLKAHALDLKSLGQFKLKSFSACSCCGFRMVMSYCDGKISSDHSVKIKESFYRFKRTAQSYGGAFILLDEPIFNKYKDLFLSLGVVEGPTFAGYTMTFIRTASDAMMKKYVDRKQKKPIDYDTRSRSLERSKNDDLCALHKIDSSVPVGYSYGFDNKNRKVTDKVDTKYPFHIVALAERAYFQQISVHRRSMEHEGFMAIAEEYPNPVHSSHDHRILPMVRVNPFFEQDR